MMDDNELVLELAKDILGRAGARHHGQQPLPRPSGAAGRGHHIRLAIPTGAWVRRMA